MLQEPGGRGLLTEFKIKGGYAFCSEVDATARSDVYRFKLTELVIIHRWSG